MKNSLKMTAVMMSAMVLAGCGDSDAQKAPAPAPLTIPADIQTSIATGNGQLCQAELVKAEIDRMVMADPQLELALGMNGILATPGGANVAQSLETRLANVALDFHNPELALLMCSADYEVPVRDRAITGRLGYSVRSTVDGKPLIEIINGDTARDVIVNASLLTVANRIDAQGGNAAHLVPENAPETSEGDALLDGLSANQSAEDATRAAQQATKEAERAAREASQAFDAVQKQQ